MKKSTVVAVCLLVAAGLYWLTLAGEMEPPGPPAPTMVTLQQIYDKLDECTGGGVCGVPKTGQTACWDSAGNSTDCAGTGQDGDHQAGVSVGTRFTANGDGTVTDNLTGLIWLQDASCFPDQNWTPALSSANTLADGSCGLTDGSVAGDWRLPNVRELHSLIDFGRYDQALPHDHPFVGVASTYYWTSTSHERFPNHAWLVSFYDGYVRFEFKTLSQLAWPVRGGQ